jgi:hypothetical protein
MEALIGPCVMCQILFIQSISDSLLLETVGLIPVIPKLSFRHNHQADGPPAIVEICFC